jgi:hypothetical protein
MQAVGRYLADMAFSVVNKCGDAQNSSPNAGDCFKASSGVLVAIEPMQTIIRGVTAWSRHVLDSFMRVFTG